MGSPFLTLILLATLAVLDTVEGVQAGAVGCFALVLAVAVGLSSHRDGAWDGGREGGKLRLRIRVAVLPGRAEEWSLLNTPRLRELGWQRPARSGVPQSCAGRSPGSSSAGGGMAASCPSLAHRVGRQEAVPVELACFGTWLASV